MLKVARMFMAALSCAVLVACGPDGVESTTPAAAVDDPQNTGTGVVAPTPTAPEAAPPEPAAPVVVDSGTSTSAPVSILDPGTDLDAPDLPIVTSPLPTTADPIPTVEQPAGAANQPIAAASATGYSALRIKATTDMGLPAEDGVGAFRLPCGYSHMGFNDPIVFPGKSGASHLHTFFGNTSTDALTSTESLLAAKNSTCAGGVANLSAYWIPSLIDSKTNRALVPSKSLFYYKKGYNNLAPTEITTPPNGLRMLGGRSATATGPHTGPYPGLIRFRCNLGAVHETIPDCPAGSELELTLQFPNCWDGKNLDSPDHRSHMAHAQGESTKRCPASHPVAIPTITLTIAYEVEPGANASQYKFSSDKYQGPGGYSFHGDVWIAWQKDIIETWMKNCVKGSRNCHAHLLGDGRMLY